MWKKVLVAMMTQNKKPGEKFMLGNFNSKLDKATCIISLIVITVITFAVKNSNALSLINVSGVFKQ